MRQKLYTIKKINTDEGQIIVEPTDYLQKLAPREAIEAVREHCNCLADTLKNTTRVDVETPEHFKKATRLLYELEVGQKYLTSLQEDYVSKITRHRLK
jgi:hypothetical protein